MERKDILRFLKIMLMIIGIVFFLSACGKTDTADKGEDATTQNEQALAENITCFQGKIVGILYDAGGTAVMGAYGGLTKGALTVAMLGFAFWFALKMIGYVSSFTEQNPAQLWTEVSKQFFLCMVCGMLAQSTSMALWTLNTLIFPIYFSFLELGSAVLSMKSGSLGSSTQCVAGESLTFSEFTCSAQLGEVSANSFPSGPKEMMGCMICGINDRLTLGWKLSIQLMSGGISNWFGGILLIVVFTIVKVSFVFYLIDTIFRMTLMLVLFPLLIIAYAFKPTKPWSITAFKIILNSSALACFIGVLLGMVLAALQKIIEMYAGFGVPSDNQSSAGSQTLIILLLAFLLKSSLTVAKAITDGFVEGGTDPSFASKGAKILAWVGMKLLSAISEGATSGLEAWMEKHEWTKRILEIRDKIKKASRRMQIKNAMQKPKPPEGGGS